MTLPGFRKQREGRLDLDAVDEFLGEFDDEADETEEGAERSAQEQRLWTRGTFAVPAFEGGDTDPSAVRTSSSTTRVAQFLASLPDVTVTPRRQTGRDSAARPARRRPRGAVAGRQRGRPKDLPAEQLPGGYRFDPRGTLRRPDGSAVPGARTVTLDTRFRFGRTRPVLVPQDAASLHPELDWCRWVAEPSTMTVRAAGRAMTVSAWLVPDEEWDDRANWPIAVTAPELAADALLGVDQVAGYLRIAESTVRAYLARGRMPVPQYHQSGRPLWSAPVILSWVRSRPR